MSRLLGPGNALLFVITAAMCAGWFLRAAVEWWPDVMDQIGSVIGLAIVTLLWHLWWWLARGPAPARK